MPVGDPVEGHGRPPRRGEREYHQDDGAQGNRRFMGRRQYTEQGEGQGEQGVRQLDQVDVADEEGLADGSGAEPTPHAELWLDFAEGMGASRDQSEHQAVPEIRELTNSFYSIASEGTPAETLAAFYAYESQVPRVATEKARGLREMYGADEKTCAYFTLHTTADVFHSQVWRQQLAKQIESNPQETENALAAGEHAAKSLWRALDGIEARRTAKAA